MPNIEQRCAGMPIEAKIKHDGRYCIVHFEHWQPDGLFAVCHPTEQPDHHIDVARENGLAASPVATSARPISEVT